MFRNGKTATANAETRNNLKIFNYQFSIINQALNSNFQHACLKIETLGID